MTRFVDSFFSNPIDPGICPRRRIGGCSRFILILSILVWARPPVCFAQPPIKLSPTDTSAESLIATGWGSLQMRADRLELTVTSIPANRQLVIPRFNNPVGPIYLKNDADKQPLTLKPGITEWFIELPKSIDEPTTGTTVVVETVGAPYLPTKPRLVLPAADGSVTLAAHDAVTHGELLRYEPQPHQNTVGYWANADDWCEWHFRVEHLGTYDVEILQGCGKDQGGSRVELTIGEQSLEFMVEDTGHFQNFKPRAIGSISIPQAGTHRLRIKPLKKAANAVMDVRQVKLTPTK